MKTITIPAVSQQYIRAQVNAFDVGANATDPTAAEVFWAFTPGNADPVSGDWLAGDWEVGVQSSGDPAYYARIMLTANQFPSGESCAMWLKVDGLTEAPVILLGTLMVV